MPRAAFRAKFPWRLTEKDVARSWSGHRVAAIKSVQSATGHWRLLAKFDGSGPPWGLRKSHLQIFLHGVKTTSNLEKTHIQTFAKVLHRNAERFDSQQFLLAVKKAVDLGLYLTWTSRLMKKPEHTRFLCRHPWRLIKVIASRLWNKLNYELGILNGRQSQQNNEVGKCSCRF